MTSDERETGRSRRAYLRAASVAAVTAAAGCSLFDDGGEGTPATTPGTTTRPTTRTTGEAGPTDGTPTSDGTRTTDPAAAGEGLPDGVDPDRYDSVVNVVEAGADSSGEEPIDSVLADNEGDDTLLYFPPGRYRLTEWEATDYRNLGVVGQDATLVPPPDVNYWLRWGSLDEFRWEGFTVDCRAENVAPTMHVGTAAGTSVVRNVAVRGHRHAPRTAFEVEVTDPNGDLSFENVSLPDGSTTGHAIYVYPESVGRLTFRNCRVEDWKEGLYAAYHRGPLRVLGGYYANNGIEQVRVGGGTNGAVVRGVTVRVDDPKQAQHKPNMRGIWAEEGGHVRIEDCDIAITDLTGTYSSGGIVVGQQFGEVEVRNTRIRTDVETFALHVRNPIDSMQGQTVPSMSSLPERTRFRARNVRISGSATTGTAVWANRRNDCRFEGLCIRHPDGSRDGVRVSEADGCSVRDSTISVGGDAVTTEGARVVTENVRTNGSCE